jgi:hypothetical protein
MLAEQDAGKWGQSGLADKGRDGAPDRYRARAPKSCAPTGRQTDWPPCHQHGTLYREVAFGDRTA